jgi:cytochrome c oxidase subunit 3
VREAEATIDLGTARRRGGRGGRGNGRGPGGGGPGGGGPGGGGDERPRGFSPESYRIGVLVGIASILMMFTALASAYVVRSGLPTSFDWRALGVPTFAWLSTGLIILSSLAYSTAKRALWREDAAKHRRWLAVTLALGLAFLGSQLMAWRQLVSQGLYLASNPHSSFFYVLTGLHALHLSGGICALGYLLARSSRPLAEGVEAGARRRALVDVVGTYWHFMDGLWVFLFLLLFFWR